MKKLLTIMLALIVGVFCLGTVACKKEDPKTESFVGVYKFYSMASSSSTLYVGDQHMLYGTLNEYSMTVTAKDDGTFTFTQRFGGITNSDGTWEKDGDVISITFLGEQSTATLNEGTLVWQHNANLTYTFKK